MAKKTYKLLSEGKTTFQSSLNKLISQGFTLEGNIATTNTSVGVNYTVLVYKE